MTSLRSSALGPLCLTDAVGKAQATLALDLSLPVDANAVLADPGGIPGRPPKPQLVAHTAIKVKSMASLEGRAQLVHSICHIELNAIDLALDIVWRFPGLPEAFYREWMVIAQEEARHFTLLREHLQTLGHDYGDFPAHNALWEMAERTRHDLLARIALVPRTLEARGLDASPAVKAKLLGAGDAAAGPILDLILHDEIGHVACGLRWYRWLCAERGLDPALAYAALVQEHRPPRLRGPFNLEARRAAGFDDAELGALGALGAMA